MGENIPASSSGSSPRKRSRRKYDKTKLPTPPPDPGEKDDFLAYLDSLQKPSAVYSRSTSAFAPIIATEDAFDHLEKLYKLMEQMLELREQNARLHRRVRDLEHLNNLEKMHKELQDAALEECPELDKDAAFAETVLESILSETKNTKQKISAPSKLRQSISRRSRNRSGSVSVSNFRHLEPPSDVKSDRRASASGSASAAVPAPTGEDAVKKPSKVSKWTKVKAAFKWEKASGTVSDAKSQDSGIGGMAPVEVARYLRVPSYDEHGHSPVDSGAAEISTPGTLSTSSSVEDFHRNDQRRSPCEDLRSSDDEHSHNYIPNSKEGSQKSNKCHKTPWAKMKDIIQTRNSFKKKHRNSAHSDDVQIDVELCSDNEDNVFEEDDKNKSEIPPEVVVRYQQSATEDDDNRSISKWTRVKEAFLPPSEVQCEEKNIEEEIQKNYQQLQKKLSLEFQEKLSEWEKIKQNSPGTSNPSSACGFVDDAKDQAFLKKMEEWQKLKSQPSIKRNIQMTREEDLSADFRKKLQEWEKIRKGSGKELTKKKLADVPRWKSLSGPRSDASPVEYPPISEDFRKKLEEWKQIKAASRNETPPKANKKQKEGQEKELQWFEKELSKIEKEKQRLERERQKYIEREEALSKLRNSVLGGLKKEVLIHTPSGFYRFEGISRKFTQKLYEWEKAQGIGPESSTFALLNSSLMQDNKYPLHKTPSGTSTLVRSKSADSIAISALNLACPLMTHQPSSLSLNDVEELEKECLQDSKSSSVQFTHSHESLTLEEPEALIVEIEDIVEETAAPLRTYAQSVEQPVYQRQELKTMCEGETIAAPKIRRIESTRAQTNYNLIEEIFSILNNLTENELEIQKTQDGVVEQEKKGNEDAIKLKMFDESQKAMSTRLNDKVARLQEANAYVFASITREEAEYNSRHIIETVETVQDLSSEICQLVEKLENDIESRNIYDICRDAGARSLNPITETAKDIKNKMLELRRRLSYICAASDLTAPRRRHSSLKKKSVKKSSSEGSEKNQKEGRLYVKADTSNTQSQGAIKKKIRSRQKSQQNRLPADSDEDDEEMGKNTHKKLTRTRSVSESSVNNTRKINEDETKEVVVDESLLQKIVVPTQTNILNISSLDIETKPTDSPVTVFVKTTRKLFVPLVESSLNREEQPEDSSVLGPSTNIAHLPPLPTPASPVLPKKTKDISPSIRLMMAKYNQDSPSVKSGNSSGSASPVLWRSPSAERRVKAQTERYQEEIKKSSPLPIQKSTSVVVVPKPAVLQRNLSVPAAAAAPKREAESDSKRLSSEIRYQKLQKAKEEFLNSPPASAPAETSENPIKFPSRNRLSQISVDSSSSIESAFGPLMKSASAGMINVDPDVYRQFDPEIHGGGYVSLPRNVKKQKGGILGGAFSNITSKFRKVKMRKGKEKNEGKMNTVSKLCRQSLVVDIQHLIDAEKKTGGKNEEMARESKSEEQSQESSNSGSWIKRSKLFKRN